MAQGCGSELSRAASAARFDGKQPGNHSASAAGSGFATSDSSPPHGGEWAHGGDGLPMKHADATGASQEVSQGPCLLLTAWLMLLVISAGHGLWCNFDLRSSNAAPLPDVPDDNVVSHGRRITVK